MSWHSNRVNGDGVTRIITAGSRGPLLRRVITPVPLSEERAQLVKSRKCNMRGNYPLHNPIPPRQKNTQTTKQTHRGRSGWRRRQVN